MSSKPPISDQLPETIFPAFDIIQINDKLKVYFLPDNNQDLIHCKIVNKAGSVFDKIPGMAYLAHILLTYGTKEKNYEQISVEQDQIGASLSSTCNFDEGGMNITALSEHSNKALQLLFECYSAPAFHQQELDRVKKKVLASIRQAKSDSSYLAHLAQMQIYFKGSAYANPSFGYENTIENITIENLKDYYHDIILNSEHAIIISGKYDKKEIIKHVNYFSKKLKNDSLQKPNIEIISNGKIYSAIEKKNAPQISLIIGSRGISISDENLAAGKIANIIFGGYFMSRLNEILREKYGFTYGIHSSFLHRRFADTLNINSSLNAENLKRAIELIDEIKTRFVSEMVSDEEFVRAQRYYLGNFNVNLETHLHISGLIKSIFMYDLKKEHYVDLLYKVKDLTKEKLFEIQKRYFNSNNSVVTVSGDIDQVNNQLSSFGDIQIVS